MMVKCADCVGRGICCKMPFVIGRKEFEVTYDICEHCKGTGEIDDGREMLHFQGLPMLTKIVVEKNTTTPEPPKQDHSTPDSGDSGRRIIID